MVTIDYFSDVLCVWAYTGQVRVDELEGVFGEQIRLRHRYISLFGDARRRIERDWAEKGGFDGFHAQLDKVCAQWDHTRLHAGVWAACQPTTSCSAHVYLKAVWLLLERGLFDAQDERLFEKLHWRIRCAFFEEARDIASFEVLREILDEFSVPHEAVQEVIESGDAYAGLQEDEALRQEFGVKGSPTFVFNEGRQMLYGNVGYRILEANVRELLERGQHADDAAWC